MWTRSLLVPACLAGALAAAPAAAQKIPFPFSYDSGAFVVRIGTDTVKVERFWMREGLLLSESVRRGRTVEIQRFEARLGADGNFDYAKALVYAWPMNPLARPTRVSTLIGYADSTVLEMGPPMAPEWRVSYPGRGSLVNLALAPFAFVQYAAVAAYAPPALGSRQSGHLVSTLGHRPLTITRESAGLVTSYSTVMGRIAYHIDEHRRLMKFDGTGSSLNFVGERIPWVDLDSVARAFDAMQQTRPSVAVLSPDDSVEATIRGARVRVKYGRPSKRGRQIFGTIVPWDKVWRAGANDATHLTTDRPIAFGTTVLPAGRYTLFVLPTPEQWTLIINRQVDQWGTDHDATHDVARIPMTVRPLKQPVEQFTISVEPTKRGGVLRMRWDDRDATAEFTTRE